MMDGQTKFKMLNFDLILLQFYIRYTRYVCVGVMLIYGLLFVINCLCYVIHLCCVMVCAPLT